MHVRILAVLAAVALVAACETAPEGAGAASGAGGAGAGAGSAAIVPGSQQDLVVNVGDRVFYDLDKSSLKPEGQKTLERQAAWLKKYPAVRILISGNCDERGTREYNLALGERRANAAKDYMVSLGISQDRLRVISYGKERPVCTASNEACWAQNRNATTSVVGAGS